METDAVSETLYSLVLRIPDVGQTKNPEILNNFGVQVSPAWTRDQILSFWRLPVVLFSSKTPSCFYLNTTMFLSADRDQLYRLSTTEQISPEDGNKTQPPKRCVLNKKQNGILHKYRTMVNVQAQNVWINVPSSQNFRSYWTHVVYGKSFIAPQIPVASFGRLQFTVRINNFYRNQSEEDLLMFRRDSKVINHV
jgi:hypothetical protein